MTNFTAWEVIKIKDFLKNKQEVIMTRLTADSSKEIVNLVFAILQKELNYEGEEADKEVYNAYGK